MYWSLIKPIRRDMSDSKDCSEHRVFGGQKVVSATAGEPWNPRCSINLCKCNEFPLRDQASGEVGKPCLANCSLWSLQCSRPAMSNRFNVGPRVFKHRSDKQGPTCGVMFTEELERDGPDPLMTARICCFSFNLWSPVISRSNSGRGYSLSVTEKTEKVGLPTTLIGL